MHESDIQLGTYSFHQQSGDTEGSSPWTIIDENVTADRFVGVLCSWTGWDAKLTAGADMYAEKHPCSTRRVGLRHLGADNC